MLIAAWHSGKRIHFNSLDCSSSLRHVGAFHLHWSKEHGLVYICAPISALWFLTTKQQTAAPSLSQAGMQSCWAAAAPGHRLMGLAPSISALPTCPMGVCSWDCRAMPTTCTGLKWTPECICWWRSWPSKACGRPACGRFAAHSSRSWIVSKPPWQVLLFTCKGGAGSPSTVAASLASGLHSLRHGLACESLRGKVWNASQIVLCVWLFFN